MSRKDEFTSSYVWVWCDANNDAPSLPHRDPAEIPLKKAEAHRAFRKGLKGPRLVRLGRARQVDADKKGMYTVEEDVDGALITRQVHKSLVLPWYEGLLLLQELELQQKEKGPRNVTNGSQLWEEKLQPILAEERNQRASLNGALYVEKKLMSVAVTCPIFVDDKGKKFHHRRPISENSEDLLEEGPDRMRFFKVSKIDAYLPPWEAFVHPKCGLYQDFYRVRWAPPYSEIDYSGWENGCQGVLGATWEPDECLPSCFDALRLAAKKNYLVQHRKLKQAVILAEKRKSQKAGSWGAREECSC